MPADLEKTLKYPLNPKPLLILGTLFAVILVASILPAFFMPSDMKTGTADVNTAFFAAFFGFVLLISAILGILLGGYMVNVSKSIIGGNMDRAPDITDFRSLMVNGLKFIVIGILYAIPPSIMMLLTIAILQVWGMLFIFAYFPLFYVFHMGAAHLAHTGSLKKALDIGYIYSLVFKNIKGFTISFFFYLIVTMVFAVAGMLIITYPLVIVASYVAGQYILTVFYMEASGLIEENKI